MHGRRRSGKTESPTAPAPVTPNPAQPAAGWIVASLLVAPAVAATPLNSSVLIFDSVTLRNAAAAVERIAAGGDRRVQFVVTAHCRLTPELRPTELGLLQNRRLSWRSPVNFEPMSDDLLAFYRKHLAKAFGRAAELGMDITLLPHLDPAGEVNEWRNGYRFDPLEAFAGHSYRSTLIEPCLDAVAAAVPRGRRVEFALSGEMGRSLFAHPASYRVLAEAIRSRLRGYDLAVGVALNHNELAGGHEPTRAERAELGRLMAGLDFVGFSNYRPFKPPATPEKFAEDSRAFLSALAAYGVRLPAGTALHLSEVGLGGAPDEAGRVTVERAAAEPWSGSSDARRNPWSSAEMIGFRRAYYDALLSYLREPPGRRPVAAAYLWSEGSWEPLGVDQPAFADRPIADAIRRHNAAARR